MPTRSASGTRGAHGTEATITSPTGEQDARPLSDAHRAPTQNVLVLLLAIRIVNALTLSTFFQPDEYFQSLEPAWQLAFGPSSGAWITWVWVDNVFFLPRSHLTRCQTPLGCMLTTSAGMENPIAVLSASSAVCGSLPHRGNAGQHL